MKTLGCKYDENQVGLFLWGKISDNEKSSEALADKVLYESNVFITPGFIFGSAGERYIRISLCCNEKMLREARERVKN
jgi:aspartate/methionine/tyrosine aminotransferase